MAALGASLGVLLFVCLVVIGVLARCIQKWKTDCRKISEASMFQRTVSSKLKSRETFFNHQTHPCPCLEIVSTTMLLFKHILCLLDTVVQSQMSLQPPVRFNRSRTFVSFWSCFPDRPRCSGSLLSTVCLNGFKPVLTYYNVVCINIITVKHRSSPCKQAGS